MSEVKLNLIDSQQVFHGTIHGSVVDACVAALSAEPETIAELTSALTRYIKRLDDRSPFATFHSSVHSSDHSPVHSWLSSSPQNTPLDTEPWDAGIVVIDLAARIVASESTYSMPHPSGEVRFHDGTISTDITVLYRLPDDWLFVNSVEAYLWSRERRGKERLAKTPLDVREVLYGAPLLDFIVNECGNIEVSEAAADGDGTVPDASGSIEAALLSELSAVHSRWLMTPREDLRRQSPRDVLLARQDFIDFDLHTRALQWTLQGEGPPCLALDSYAYRFAGFGTHEWVVYYDLVRHLLWSAPTGGRFGRGDVSTPARLPRWGPRLSLHADNETLIARLEELKSNWLERPQPDYDGRIPAIIIENERKRLPLTLSAQDMIIDEDCDLCRMSANEVAMGFGPCFWHLDGSHMDDDFAFSWYKTREEWEAENRRREEFDKEFNRRWEDRQQRIARGEPRPGSPDGQPGWGGGPDPFFDPDPFPDLEFDDSSWVSDEPIDDDEKEFPQ